MLFASTTSPIINNYKISFRAPKDKVCKFIATTKENICRYHNFVVLRKHFVYIIFHQSGFINVTKLKNLDEVRQAVCDFHIWIDWQQQQPHSFTVDNITASGRLGKAIPLLRLKRHFTTSQIRVTFKPELFAGLSIKYNTFELRGTIILFETGSYTIVGVKTCADVQKVYSHTVNSLSTLT